MLLTTVGTEQFPFNRLMNWLTILIQAGIIEDELICQYGTCTTLPPGARVYSLLPENQFRDLVDRAQVIISHCGEGSVNILDGSGKPYILVPRTYKLGEHVDNHQVELASALSRQGIPIAWGPGDIVRFLAEPKRVLMPPSSAAALCRMLCNRFGG